MASKLACLFALFLLSVDVWANPLVVPRGTGGVQPAFMRRNVSGGAQLTLDPMLLGRSIEHFNANQPAGRRLKKRGGCCSKPSGHEETTPPARPHTDTGGGTPAPPPPPPPPPNTGVQRTPKPASSQPQPQNPQSPQGESSTPTQRKEMTPEDHEKKGAKINQDIDQQFKPDNPTDRVDHAAVDKKFNAGYQVSDGQTNRPPRGGNFQQTGPPGNMKDQMGKSNLPTGDDYSNVKIHSKMDPEDPTKKTPTNALGLPQRDPVTDRSHADGAIVGQSAYADKDANNKKGADSTNALPSSDLMAKGHEAAGHDFGQTQGVVAQQVVNPDSQRTIKAVHDGQPGWKTTDKGDEPGNFNRLTGTDNLQIPAHATADRAGTGPGKPTQISSYNPPEGSSDKPAAIMHLPGQGGNQQPPAGGGTPPAPERSSTLPPPASEGSTTPTSLSRRPSLKRKRALRLRRRAPVHVPVLFY